MGIVEEEADESAFWIEFSVDAHLSRTERVGELLDEAEQLVKIFVASINTARGGKR